MPWVGVGLSSGTLAVEGVDTASVGGWGFLEERGFIGSSLLRKPPLREHLLGVSCQCGSTY